MEAGPSGLPGYGRRGFGDAFEVIDPIDDRGDHFGAVHTGRQGVGQRIDKDAGSPAAVPGRRRQRRAETDGAVGVVEELLRILAEFAEQSDPYMPVFILMGEPAPKPMHHRRAFRRELRKTELLDDGLSRTGLLGTRIGVEQADDLVVGLDHRRATTPAVPGGPQRS